MMILLIVLVRLSSNNRNILKLLTAFELFLAIQQQTQEPNADAHSEGSVTPSSLLRMSLAAPRRGGVSQNCEGSTGTKRTIAAGGPELDERHSRVRKRDVCTA